MQVCWSFLVQYCCDHAWNRCRVPANKLPILKYRPDPLFFLTLLFSVGIVIWWLVERHSSYAWIIQNVLGFAFIAYLLGRFTFLQAWIVALLMTLLFFYDIFMVFITPYFTSVSDSVTVHYRCMSINFSSPCPILAVLIRDQ